MKNLDEMTRQELEDACVIEDGVLPTATSEDLKAIKAMSKEELHAALFQWMVDGDECA